MSKFKKLISGSQPVLVDFYAEWCGPCKAMGPILNDVAKQVGDKARIVKVNVDKNKQAALNYQVRSIPTLIVFKNGKPVWRHTGIAQADQLKNTLLQHT